MKSDLWFAIAAAIEIRRPRVERPDEKKKERAFRPAQGGIVGGPHIPPGATELGRAAPAGAG